MFALIENNEIKQVGELYVLFPNTSNPTAEFAKEQGALEVIEGEQKDQRYYWVSFDKYEIQSDFVIRTYSNIPKQLEDTTNTNEETQEISITKGLKSQSIDQVRNTTYTLLCKTDWAVIRKSERNIDIPQDIITEREHILLECDRLETDISAVTSIEELIEVMSNQNWIVSQI
jgi:hypothetical protein